MKSAKLAEAVILQAMDDIYNEDLRAESLQFFTGNGFYYAAKIAGMGYRQMLGILEYVNQIVTSLSPSQKRPVPMGLSATRRSIMSGHMRHQ